MSENYKETIKSKYLNKLLKIVSHDDRTLIGKFKCIDNLGNLFLTEVVEVFDKSGDYYFNFNMFDNTKDHIFNFESEIKQYQLYSPVIVPKSQIKNIIILKSEIENSTE
jgi:small nuclear ribonucleoprotein (snRNP)-like protein